MSVSLRLSRGGSKKRPFFRIVAADIRAPRDGRYIERLGTYNPMREQSDPERVSLNLERIKYWLSVGAKPTDRVIGFLAKEGLLKKPPTPKQTKQDKPKKKTIEKLKAKEEKLKAKEEMEKAAENVPNTQVPESKADDKPAEKVTPPAEDKPAEQAKAEDKPAETATPPAEDKPAVQAKAEDKPVETATPPAEDKPVEQAKVEDKPAEKTTPPAEDKKS